MKYKVHKLIEEKNSKRKAALENRIKNQLNIVDETNTDKAEYMCKKPFYKTYRFFAGVSSALAAICLAIVLPIALGKGEQAPSLFYCNADDCVEIQIEYSIKEYGQKNNKAYLYIDWYDIAEEVQTKLFVNAEKTDELIYVQELLVDGETGSIAVLYVTDLFTRVDILDELWIGCVAKIEINEISVYWGSNNIVSKAYFEYGNYRYFIELNYPLSDDYILKLIEEMLP